MFSGWWTDVCPRGPAILASSRCRSVGRPARHEGARAVAEIRPLRWRVVPDRAVASAPIEPGGRVRTPAAVHGDRDVGADPEPGAEVVRVLSTVVVQLPAGQVVP